MKRYLYMEPEEIATLLTDALTTGLGRSLDDREKRYVIHHSESCFECSGLLLDWIRELKSASSLNNVIGVDEASELWSLSPGYIKNLCAAGKIICKKVGKTWVIDATQPNPSKSSF